MNAKRTQRLAALLMVFAVLVGIFPTTAFAEEHVHTDGCYAQEGDLLCSLEEVSDHTHTEDCYCAGGEHICGLEESESNNSDDCYECEDDTDVLEYDEDEPISHIHTEDCICPGGELICDVEESEGHSHAEVCYAQGGELICGEAVEPTDEMPVTITPELKADDEKNESASNVYDYIKELLINDDSMDFDPETQTFAVIATENELTDHLRELNVFGLDDIAEMLEEDGEGLNFRVAINGEFVQKGEPYYVVSADAEALEARTYQGRIWDQDGQLWLNVDEVGVVILDQDDEYEIFFDISDNYYAHIDHTYNGEGYTVRPLDGRVRKTFSGQAGNDVIETEFSFEWNLCSWLDIEIYSADPVTKVLDNPGFMDIEGYINFKIELRDAQGNIFSLPRTFYNNYGSDDEFIFMEQDGIVRIALEPYDDDLLPHSTPYGEFDVYIPFGYDYRITLMDYSVDTLGGYAYVTNQEHEYDTDGFCLTDLDTAYSNEWGSFIEVTFMPLVNEIKVEKRAEGNAPENESYTFLAEQNVYSFAENQITYFYEPTHDLSQLLIGYPYDLYDANTNERLNTEPLKTDKKGRFTLKANQYAVFKTWELPADLLEYAEWGFTFSDVYESNPTTAIESEYSYQELGSTNCETTITLIHNEVQTSINEKKIEGVLGNDAILFTNRYADETAATGGLTVSNAVSGNAASTTKDFNITVFLSDTSINGTYGDMTFVNGIANFTLRHGEKHTASGLPVGINYTVTERESNQDGYVTSVTKGTGVIVESETVAVSFENVKNAGNSNIPNNGETPSLGTGNVGGTTVPTPAEVTITAQKTMDGVAAKGSNYSFVLKDESGSIIQTVQNSDGKITVDTLSFSKVGTYVYTLSEVIGTDSTISYDSSVYTLTIVVTRSDNYDVTLRYEKNGTAYSGIPVFANTTKPTTPNNRDDSNTSDSPSTPSTPNLPSTTNPPSLSNKPSSADDSNTSDNLNPPSEPAVSDTTSFSNVTSSPNEASSGNTFSSTSTSNPPERYVDEVPQTGDDSHIELWATLSCLSLIAMMVSVLAKKRRSTRR